MVIVALLIGLAAGLILPISFEHIIAVGMISSIINPHLTAVYAVAILGLGVSAFLKNYTKTAVNEEANKIKASTDQEYVKVINKVSDKYKQFILLLIGSGFCIGLLSQLTGLHTFLMPTSIIVILLNTISYLFNSKSEKGVIRNTIAVLIISVLAVIAVKQPTSGGVFTYFLSVISIPSMFIKNKTKTSNNGVLERLNLKSAFLYGAGSNLLVAPIILNQTILMGSGKDALGTIINGDASIILDPNRIAIAFIVIIFALIYNYMFFSKDILKAVNNHKKNKKEKRGISLLISILSLTIGVINLSLPIVLVMSIGGLIANIIVKDKQALRAAAVPALLLSGVFLG